MYVCIMYLSEVCLVNAITEKRTRIMIRQNVSFRFAFIKYASIRLQEVRGCIIIICNLYFGYAQLCEFKWLCKVQY